VSRNRSLTGEPFFTEYQLSPFSQKVQGMSIDREKSAKHLLRAPRNI